VHTVSTASPPGDTRRERLTANDFERSWTSTALPTVSAALRRCLDGVTARSILDVGCGYGGIAATLRDDLGVEEAHGVDVDRDVLGEARAKGVRAVRAEVGEEPLPYGDASFDIVTCFGMLDYLPWYDAAVDEISRVLAPEGTVAVALPNLASWHNRLALLLGYQPRDVEFCTRKTVGLAPFYSSDVPVGHIHTPTIRAFREFMQLFGFAELETVALRRTSAAPVALQVVDRVLGRVPSPSRRFLYIGRRVSDPLPVTRTGWWARRR